MDSAREKFLQEHAAEIEAMAAIDQLEGRRDKVTADRDVALSKVHEKFAKEEREIDLDLALAVSTARESMSAKKLASAIGISVDRQKKLIDLLDSDSSGDDQTADDNVDSAAISPDDSNA